MAPLPDADVAAALAAVQAGQAQDGCKLLVGLDAPRVLWANRQAEALFGTTERLALSRMMFGTASEGRPLATRLGRLEPGAPPRLEGVQVASRFSRALVVFRCAAVPGSTPKMILFEAAVAPTQRETARPEAHLALSSTEELSSLPNDPAPVSAPVNRPMTLRHRSRDDAQPAARFTWRTDPHGVLTQVGAEMQAMVGRAALQVGDNLENRLRAIGSASALEAADALATGQSWSGLVVAWSADEPGVAARVELGGTPAPGGSGYLGFGLIAEPLSKTTPQEDAPSPAGPKPDVVPAEPEQFEDVEAVATGNAEAGATPIADEPAPRSGIAPPLASDDAVMPVEAADGAAAPFRDEVDAEPAILAAPILVAGSDEMPSDSLGSPESAGAGPAPSAADPSPPAAVSADDESPVSEPATAAQLPRARLMHFPRAIESGTAKIVHLAAFKTGLPALSGKVAVRRSPPAAPVEPPAELSLAAPQWAEAPSARLSADAPDQRLSNHERFNFDEIARALATLPLVDVGERNGVAGTVKDGSQGAPSARREESDPVFAAPPPAESTTGFLDALPVGILIARGEHILVANRAFLDLVDYRDVDAVERAGGLGSLLGSAPSGREERRTERQILVRTRDGSDVQVHAMIRTVAWGGETAMLWVVRRAETPRASMPSRARPAGPDETDLVEALELAASGVVFLDGEGRIVSANGGAERLLGYPERDLIGTDCPRLFADDPAANWSDVFDQFAETAPARHSAFRKMVARKRSGDEVPVGISLRRIGPDRICMVLQQTVHGHATASELDLLRRDAERASALKSEFLAKISHEIRTPLNAILGFTEIIIDERFGPIGNDRYREYLRDIHASGTHVVSLVNDLLDLSRIEAGAQELKLVPVDMNAIISECVGTLQGQAYRDRVVIRSALAPGHPMALGDDRSMRQIVLNLLSNAVKFNEPGGQVILSTAISDAGRVLVRVRDTGPGMSASDIETAMKPFRQLAGPRADAGTGLGLPLTKAMVEACQGHLKITSKPGDGTLAEVTFQRAPDLPVSLPAE